MAASDRGLDFLRVVPIYVTDVSNKYLMQEFQACVYYISTYFNCFFESNSVPPNKYPSPLTLESFPTSLSVLPYTHYLLCLLCQISILTL